MTKVRQKILEVLKQQSYRSMDYSSDPKIKATDVELEALTSSLVDIIEEAEKRARVAHAPTTENEGGLRCLKCGGPWPKGYKEKDQK